MGVIKLLNTNRHTSVTVRAFDGEEVTLPAGQKEAVPVDEKFNWMLPPGVRNETARKNRRNIDLTQDPDADNSETNNEENKNPVEEESNKIPNKIVGPTAPVNATQENNDSLNKDAAAKDAAQPTIVPK